MPLKMLLLGDAERASATEAQHLAQEAERARVALNEAKSVRETEWLRAQWEQAQARAASANNRVDAAVVRSCRAWLNGLRDDVVL